MRKNLIYYLLCLCILLSGCANSSTYSADSQENLLGYEEESVVNEENNTISDTTSSTESTEEAEPIEEQLAEETISPAVGFEYEILDDGTVEITKYVGSDATVVIGAVDGRDVSSIGYRAFYSCDSLKAVTIPQSVEQIGEEAFAFSEIEAVVINSGTIGDKAFESCDDLEEVVISEGVTSIGYRAFYSCDSLKTVTIPQSVEQIGEEAFAFSEIEAVVINSGTIGDKAFESCDDLEEVAISEGVTSIGYRAFYSCDSLKAVTIPKSVEQIGEEAFAFSGIEAVVINSGTIGDKAFESCDDLEEVAISEGVTSIGYRAFYSCDSLKTVTIPQSVEQTGEEAFAFSEIEAVVINSGTIGDKAFESCDDLEEVAISEGVTSIGYRAFYSCDSLKAVTIPKSVEQIGEEAFAFSGIEAVVINSGTIGDKAFESCDDLEEVAISEGVTSIGYRAFYSCDSLKAVTIPKSVEQIGEDAFAYCSNLPNKPQSTSNRVISTTAPTEPMNSSEPDERKQTYIANGTFTYSARDFMKRFDKIDENAKNYNYAYARKNDETSLYYQIIDIKDNYRSVGMISFSKDIDTTLSKDEDYTENIVTKIKVLVADADDVAGILISCMCATDPTLDYADAYNVGLDIVECAGTANGYTHNDINYVIAKDDYYFIFITIDD